MEQGITSGTTFSPDEPCTRGQIATFLYRCLNETGEKAYVPAEPVSPSPSRQDPKEERTPLRTLTGTGKAYSLGLDGSEFNSEDVYEAEVSVDIYSAYEAVFTVQVPFPLFQACSYSARFDDPQQSGEGFLFTCLRWDEAFADMIPWEGEHYNHRFSDMTGVQRKETSFLVQHEDEDRIGGTISWRVFITPGGGFNFDLLDSYELSCEVSSNP